MSVYYLEEDDSSHDTDQWNLCVQMKDVSKLARETYHRIMEHTSVQNKPHPGRPSHKAADKAPDTV